MNHDSVEIDDLVDEDKHQTPFFLHRPPERPLIIAHRGYRACFPENTLLAFNRSVGRCEDRKST
ncbi:MAG: hypothetical protein AB7U29_18995, partial [Desulfobulbus sp.]